MAVLQEDVEEEHRGIISGVQNGVSTSFFFMLIIFDKYVRKYCQLFRYFVISDELIDGYNQICSCDIFTGGGNLWLSHYCFLYINTIWSYFICQPCNNKIKKSQGRSWILNTMPRGIIHCDSPINFFKNTILEYKSLIMH